MTETRKHAALTNNDAKYSLIKDDNFAVMFADEPTKGNCLYIMYTPYDRPSLCVVIKPNKQGEQDIQNLLTEGWIEGEA